MILATCLECETEYISAVTEQLIFILFFFFTKIKIIEKILIFTSLCYSYTKGFIALRPAYIGCGRCGDVYPQADDLLILHIRKNVRFTHNSNPIKITPWCNYMVNNN